MPRLLRLAKCQGYASFACGCGGILCPILQRSPAGDSTLMTSAPKSDKITAALGPAIKLAKSTTFNPEKILSFVIAVPSESPAAISFTLKLGCTFLEEGRGTLLLVFGGSTNAKVGRFQSETFALGGFQPFVDRLQRELQGDRRVGEDLFQDRLGSRHEIGRRDNFIDEADAVRFLGGDRLSRKDQLQRSPLADQPRQALRSAAAWQQPQLDFRLSKPGMLNSNPDGTGHCRLATTAKRKAIDGRDYRLAQVFDEVQHTLAKPTGLLRIVGIDVCKFADVCACDESLVAGARKNDAAHGGILLYVFEGGMQIGPGRCIQRVQHLGPIDRHIRDRSLLLVPNVRKLQYCLGRGIGYCCGRRCH